MSAIRRVGNGKRDEHLKTSSGSPLTLRRRSESTVTWHSAAESTALTVALAAASPVTCATAFAAVRYWFSACLTQVAALVCEVGVRLGTRFPMASWEMGAILGRNCASVWFVSFVSREGMIALSTPTLFSPREAPRASEAQRRLPCPPLSARAGPKPTSPLPSRCGNLRPFPMPPKAKLTNENERHQRSERPGSASVHGRPATRLLAGAQDRHPDRHPPYHCQRRATAAALRRRTPPAG